MITSSIPIRVYLLGKFEAHRAGSILKSSEWSRRKAAVLFQRLIYEQRLVKEQAIEYLWPQASLTSGANNLYRILHTMRKTLDAILGPGAAEEIFTFEDGILLASNSIWVDAIEFERLCQVLPGELPWERLARFTEALDIYQGEFLPDERYEEWTDLPRTALNRLHREVSLTLARHHLEQRDFSTVTGLLASLLANDPADEQTHYELMRLYATAGRRQEALRQYQVCEQVLLAELGVEPAIETTALYSQIQKGEFPSTDSSHQTSTLDGMEAVSSQPLTSGSLEPSRHRPRPPFVGRGRELNVLNNHLQAVLSGRGGVVFIAGEAGQGKTSLMSEFAYQSQASHPELVVAAGACQAFTGYADPYLPFRDMLALLSGDVQRPWLGGEISTSHLQRLRAIAPQTFQVFSTHASGLKDVLVPGKLAAHSPVQSFNTLNQGQIFEQMRTLLHTLSQNQPLLLILDDLQWADIASTNLLFYLGRQLVDSPVLLLGAYRPSEVSVPFLWQEISERDSPHPLASVIRELIRSRGDILIDLDAYSTASRRSFIDELLDSEPNRLDVAFREALFNRTKGQPLFTIELLRALQEQGDLVKDQAGIWEDVPDLDWNVLPARVEAVIARRVEQLPQELRQLLSLASVEGEYFTVEVLAQVREMDRLTLLQYLSQELDRRYRLVREQGELRLGGQVLTRYQFRHNLFQQYIYQQLGVGEKRYLHGLIASVLERTAGDDLDEVSIALAHHFLEAGQTSRAVPFLCRAGDQARRRVALEEAIQFYQSALLHWQEQGASAHAQVLHKLGESQLAIGRSETAIGHFLEAEELYAQAGNPTGRGAVHRLIGRSYWEQADRANAMAHYQEALSLLDGGMEDAELARAISAISQMYMLADEYDQAILWGERAVAIGRELQVEDVIVHTLTTLGVSWIVKGQVEQGLSMLLESREMAQSLGLPHDTCRAYTGLGDSLVRLERYTQAAETYEQMLAYSRKISAAMFEGVALVQLGYLDWWAGRWRMAQSRCQAIRDWLEASPGITISKVWASTFLGGMYIDLGQIEEARAVLSGYTAVARTASEPQTTVPHLKELARLSQSDGEKAVLVQEILSLIDASPDPRYEIMPALTLASEWLAESSGGTLSALNRLEDAHRKAQSRQSAASLYEAKGYVARVRGEWAQSVSFYAEAAGHWEALNRPYDLLRVWAGMGHALTQISDLRAAREVVREAGSMIDQLLAELDDPEQKAAFLNSPWVRAIRQIRGFTTAIPEEPFN